MEEERRVALRRIMRELRHDETAVVELYQEFHDEIAQVVGFLARRRRPRIDADDLEALVFDACLALARVAPSWRPDGGALPWVWARGRIVALVEAALPPPARSLPDEDDLPPAPATLGAACADDPDVGVVLARLAERDQRVALLALAMRESVGLRDGTIWLRYRIQQQAGDPSPAHTVGNQVGLRPPAVRQRASRARRRLVRHVSRDPRFAPLADLPLLASAA